MRIDEREVERNRVALIAIVGELDTHGAGMLQRKVQDLIERGSLRVVVDLAETAYVNSSGLGSLLIARKRLQGAGGDLRLCSPQPGVAQVLGVVGLGAAIEILPTCEEAVAALRLAVPGEGLAERPDQPV